MVIAATTSEQKEGERSGKIIELRALLAEKFPATVSVPPVRARFVTGVEVLDRFLDGRAAAGGFDRGGLPGTRYRQRYDHPCS